MAQRDGQRVGHVGRLGIGGEAKLLADGFLDLPLGGVAVAGDRFLDLRRRVAVHGMPASAAASRITPRAWPIRIAVVGRS